MTEILTGCKSHFPTSQWCYLTKSNSLEKTKGSDWEKTGQNRLQFDKKAPNRVFFKKRHHLMYWSEHFLYLVVQ